MSSNAREIPASPDEVFAVLSDPTTFPDWLIGDSEIRDFDHNWPSPGSKIHHLIGVKPFTLPDDSEVIDVEPNRSLTLRVRIRPFFVGNVTFRLVGGPDRTVVSIDEEPVPALVAAITRPIVDPLLHARNHRTLIRLERFLEARNAETHPRPGSVTSPHDSSCRVPQG